MQEKKDGSQHIVHLSTHTHRDKCPGQKECDAAIDSLNATINQLDQAVLAAMSQQLPGRWVFGVHGQTLGRHQQAAGGLDHIATSLMCVCLEEGRGEGEGREGGVRLAKTLL